jgi:multiphosphoryl transfer protein
MGSGINLEVCNRTGFHARPAREFVNLAKQFRSQVLVHHQDRRADGKSLVSLLTLGVKQGSLIRIEAEGDDSDEAIRTLAAAVRAGLNDAAAVPPPAAANPGCRGMPAAPGLVVGPTWRWERRPLPAEQPAASPSVERSRLERALTVAGQELAVLRDRLTAEAGPAEAAILGVQNGLLEDPVLLEEAFARIAGGQGAERAWRATLEVHAAGITRLDDPLLASRAADVRDLAERVCRLLSGAGRVSSAPLPDHPVVLIADDLSPSETASLDPRRILGICTAAGGPASHTATLARALAVPYVANAGPEVLSWPDGTVAVLDGDTGELTANPDPETLARVREKQRSREERRKLSEASAAAPAVTRDGRQVDVLANVVGAGEAERALAAGADGVGLLRTEFLFLNRRGPPGEEEQVRIYRAVGRALQGRPVTIRTLDAGGDKTLGYLDLRPEANPVLGERGIRLCLARPRLLREQLRAVLRAGSAGRLRIMIPMVTEITELRAVRAMVAEIAAEIGVPPLEVGVMIEVPAAAILAGALAREADFLSVGTNDLAQYTLAMDRTHATLGARADALHPAVLTLIAGTVEAAHRAGKKVGVCGELGCDPIAIPILVGLGVDELSVNLPALASVKAQIRALSFEEAKKIAAKALGCVTAEEVRAGCRLLVDG